MADCERNYDLKSVRKELLAIYSVFKCICEHHGLRHWVVYGTLIGAVRHQGFIPWDDDFDVAMPRPDYEKFHAVVQRELPSNYIWCSVRTDPEHGLAFGKLKNQDVNTLARVAKESNLKMTQGLFIDVFPFDGFPSSNVGEFFWFAIRAFLRRYATLRFLEKCFSLIHYECSTYIVNGNSAWGFRSKMRMIKCRSWVDCLVEVPFEDTTVTIPSCYDLYLKCEFGDYMQLPPPDQRKPSHQTLN